MTISEFTQKFLPYAQADERASGVPALFTLAQAALETGWKIGPGNMMFGIKAGSSWKGKRQLLTTTEVVYPSQLSAFPIVLSREDAGGGKVRARVMDYFRAYSNPGESFRDHSALLKTDRYRGAFQTRDPYRFAEYIARAGYATAPDYADALKRVITQIKFATSGLPLEKISSGTKILPAIAVLSFGLFIGKKLL